MEENPKYDAEFRVRLPSVLADRIANTAEKDHRSRNQQYVYILENWFEINENFEERIRHIENILSGKSSHRLINTKVE